MLAHSIKPILSLIPEATTLVKQASLDQDMPTDSRDSCIASALALKYQECISHKPVDYSAFEKVAQAVDLYGVTKLVSNLSSKMVKEATLRSVAAMRDPKTEYLTKQAGFAGDFSGFADLAKISEDAISMYKQAEALRVEPSVEVKRYSGHGFLNKEAAIEALANRFHATNNPNFVKIASAIYKMDTQGMKTETILDICKTVTSMDKEAQLSTRGFDFYRESILVKSAASVLTVKLLNKDCPYESIARVGRDRVAQFIGEDVANCMDAGPAEAKVVIETLPRDLQTVLSNLIKNT